MERGWLRPAVLSREEGMGYGDPAQAKRWGIKVFTL